MNQFPNKKDRIIVLVLWFVFFITAVSFDLFLLAFQDIGTIITAVISSIGSIVLFILIKKVSKGYFLKYYFNKKQFNKLFNESLEKYKGADEEFIKDFKRRAKYQYYTSGVILYTPSIEDDKWLLSDKANFTGLCLLIEILNSSISNRLGFNEFIDKSFSLTHNGELTIKTLENEFITKELRFLLYRVFLLTEFNLSDNGLSDEYTNKVQQIREELRNRYDKLLYNFEEEVIRLKDRLTKYRETLDNSDSSNLN